jgi:hypothetical protein
VPATASRRRERVHTSIVHRGLDHRLVHHDNFIFFVVIITTGLQLTIDPTVT